MEINNVMTESHPEFIERLGQTIQEYHDTAGQGPLTHFADLYFKRVALAEFQGRQYKDLYGFISGWRQMIDSYQDDAARIKVYNPNLEEHGWLCGHTVIQIHVKDSPFLTDSVRL